jgi:hypothetical protein
VLSSHLNNDFGIFHMASPSERVQVSDGGERFPGGIVTQQVRASECDEGVSPRWQRRCRLR